MTALACLLVLGGVQPRPALDQLARAVADQTRAASPEAPLALYVDGAPPVLARTFASILASELSAHQLAPLMLELPSAGEAEAAAQKKDVRFLLRVTVALEGDRLWARGDLLPTWVNFWSGATPTRSGPAAVIALSAAADEQTRALASAAGPTVPSSLSLQVSVLARLPEVPLAVAAADLDGDKKCELAVLTDSAVWLLSGEGRVLARADVHSVAASPSPSREPFGAVAITASPPRIAWLSSRHLTGELLSWAQGALKPLSSVQEVQIDAVTARPMSGLNLFSSTVAMAGKSATLPAAFSATSTRGPVTLVVYPDGSGSLFKSLPVAGRFTGVGAGSALANLSGDGSTSLAVTSTRFFPDGDEVRVFDLPTVEALQARGASVLDATPLWRGTTPRGRALVAVGADLDGDGAEELVLGAWLADGTGELQVARRAASPPK